MPQQAANEWELLVEGEALSAIERDSLPAFLEHQRWYAGKARALESVHIIDAARSDDFPPSSFLALIELKYADGPPATYFLPLRVARGPEAERLLREAPGRVISRLQGADELRVIYDGLFDPATCWALLLAIEQGRSFSSRIGKFRAIPTAAYDRARGPKKVPLEVIRGSAEQSNSAVLFDHRLLLKVFRRIEPGINPDFEIGRFLSERTSFDRIPRTAGTIEYHPHGEEPATLAILQTLVSNRGTGWEHALHELSSYLEGSSRRTVPDELKRDLGRSIVELSTGSVPDTAARLIGPYLRSAAVLGRRTAELHRALASDPSDPNFAPEPLDASDLSELRDSIQGQVARALDTLEETVGKLADSLVPQARRVLDEGPALLKQLDMLPELAPTASKIRCHGDFHLGQVLRTEDDFVILDFEGEPAKALGERREKQPALKDVVGMIRSFEYAAYAALFKFTKERPEDFERLAPWAHFWQMWTSAVFLKEYRARAEGAEFLPVNAEELGLLFRAFMLDKTLYELNYELNNRPEWVRIPLQGVIGLIEDAHATPPTMPAALEPAGPGATQEMVSATRLGDFDLYLLAEGTHYRSYEKLGAHVSPWHSAAATSFGVWAPNARGVSVVGDFNAWDPTAHPLFPRGNNGIWERVVPGAGEGQRYRYSVVGPDGSRFEKADPYGFAAELRPGTASIVWDLSNHAWGDAEWMATRSKANSASAPITIYEVHLGSWMRVPEEGNRWLSYRELAPKLADYVHGMGYTHVELLPIAEHPFDGSWGYQVTGYFAPTSRFGTPDDFRFLVDTLHQRGIGVILDWVPAHFPNDEHGLREFDGTSLYEYADPRQGRHPDWNTCIFNTGRPEVANFLISNALFWLDKYHIDGLRVDAVASMLYLDYSRKPGEWVPNEYGGRENLEAIALLRRVNERVHAEFPGTLTIAEESTAWPMVSRPTNVGGLGFDMKWDLGWMHDTLKCLGIDPLFRKHNHNLLTFRGLYAFGECFVLPLSHDEVVHGKGSLLNKMAGDDWQKFANLRLALGWMHAQPGKKLLFMADDLAQWREWNHDTSLDWHLLNEPAHRGFNRWVRDLNTVYRAHPSLHRQDCHPSGFQWADCHDAEQSVISLFRKDESSDDWVLFVLNFTPVPRHNYRVGVPRSGSWSEILNSDALLYGGSGQGNIGGVRTAPVYWHGQPQSLNLTVPPLGLIALKWTGK